MRTVLSSDKEAKAMTQENVKVRTAARIANVPMWKIAAAIGISEPTLTRWLRFPLPADKECRILEAISKLEGVTDRNGKC